MKCYLPFVGDLTPAAQNLRRIAHLIGADCVPVRLGPRSSNPIGELEHSVTGETACAAICPEVIDAWLEAGKIPSSLVAYFRQRFSFILIHELDANPASDRLLRAFSRGVLNSARKVEDLASGYNVASLDLCERFAGLKFGPANAADCTLATESVHSLLEPIVTIGNLPIFARLKDGLGELFFLGGVGSGDIESGKDLSGKRVAAYFREIAPVVMFLRHSFRNECWRPANPPGATFIVDDPPLWKRYGFLDYATLMSLTDEFNFHTTIAFIPYYWKTTAASTVRLFKERPDRLSICFHGNDHTAAEFASQDDRTLDSLLTTATTRMNAFTQRTGIPCDRVIVFPQGNFSRTAMRALKAHDFLGAVNSGHAPYKEQPHLTLSDLIQPAVSSLEHFPLFLRKYVDDIRQEDIAWNAFFGRPVLIVEHHEVFKAPAALLELVSTINKMLPDVCWANLQTVLENACLKRSEADGTLRILPYAMAGRVRNPDQSVLKFLPEWPDGSKGNSKVVFSIGGCSIDLSPRSAFEIPPQAFGRIVLQPPPRSSGAFDPEVSLRQLLKVHLRRRLSEIRDNYMSRNRATMALVRLIREHIL
jgi:hypothetical protein